MLHLALIALLGAPGVPPQLPKLSRASHASRGVALRMCPGLCGPNFQGSLGESLTFARASASVCNNDDGTATALASGVPCMPKGTSSAPSGYGARPRQQVIQLIQFSNAMATSPWSTGTGTCAAPTVANNTTDLLDRYGGNTATKVTFPACSAGGSFTTMGQTYTGTAAAYSQAIWIRTLSGTYSVNLIATQSGGAGSGNFVNCTANSTSWTRCILPNVTESALTWAYEFGFDGRGVGSTAISAGTVYVADAYAALGTVAKDDCQTAGATATCLADTVTTASTYNLGALGCMSVDLINDIGFNNSNDRILQGHSNTGGIVVNSASGQVGVCKSSGVCVAGVGASTFGAGRHHVTAWWNSTTTNAQACLDGACGSVGSGYDGTIISNEAIDIGTYGTGTNDINATLSNLIVGSRPEDCP